MKTIVAFLLLALINPIFAQDAASVVNETHHIDQAYKREILFLTAQKRELEKRRADYLNLTRSQESSNQKKIDQLEALLAKTKLEQEAMDRELTLLSRDAQDREGVTKNLETMMARAQSSLGVDQKTDENLLQELNYLFDVAIEQLTKAQGIHLTQSDFFDQQGVQVQGNRLHLGRIADFSWSDSSNEAHILVPAGNGEMKSYLTTSKADLQQQIKTGGLLTVFLHESSSREYIPKQDKNLSDTMRAAGAIGWVIVILGFITLFMILLRGWMLYQTTKQIKTEAQILIERLTMGPIEEVQSTLEKSSNAFSRLICRLIEKRHLPKEELQDIASEQLLREWSLIDRFGTMILVAASVAPLLGLLGTVTGMISTFDIITEFGTGDPKLLSTGISEALVTTMLGLMVAIPALIFGSLLSAQSEKIKSKMEELVLQFFNSMTKVES